MRRVRTNGVIKWGGDLIFVSEALIGEPVAVEETEDGEWLVRYAHVELGFIDPSGRLRRRKLSKPRRACPDLWTTPRVAHRAHRPHRRTRNNSNNRTRKWPKVSTMYPVQSVNLLSGRTQDLAVGLAPNEAGWHAAAQFTTGRLMTNPAVQPGAQDVSSGRFSTPG